tara:strand:+ start:207 stop:368 length:162 start_codon:yes stop_codon:yes gene_type:complete
VVQSIFLAGFITRRQFDLKRRLIQAIRSLNYGQLKIFFDFKFIIIIKTPPNLL